MYPQRNGNSVIKYYELHRSVWAAKYYIYNKLQSTLDHLAKSISISFIRRFAPVCIIDDEPWSIWSMPSFLFIFLSIGISWLSSSTLMFYTPFETFSSTQKSPLRYELAKSTFNYGDLSRQSSRANFTFETTNDYSSGRRHSIADVHKHVIKHLRSESHLNINTHSITHCGRSKVMAELRQIGKKNNWCGFHHDIR